MVPLLLLLFSSANPALAVADPQPTSAAAMGGDAGVSPALPKATASVATAAAGDPADDDDDDADSAAAIEGASAELQAARALESRALAEEERRNRERALAPRTVGPGNPLLNKLNDLPDLLPEADQDAREARQIARELEQFETFDAEQAASHYDIPVELNQQVSQYIRMFQGPLRSHFVLWLARSGRYIPRMREILQQQGIPEDTVFLSLIESGFSTLAYSVARAAGQWQFIASTGRRFGLRSDFWVDERRDPEKATAAAARYLKELRGQLGSWYLAWAGYNAGAGTISKAIRRQHTTDFWELMRGRVLRSETKGYVPKLIAAALISKHPRAFGFDELSYEQPLASETVAVPESTELSFLAEAAHTDVETLRDLNPGLRRFCTPPPLNGEPYSVRVPAGTAEAVLGALASRPPQARLSFRYHRVMSGEGLGTVARSFRVAPEAIARMNGLHHQALRPGRDLVIPVAAGQTSDGRVATVTDEREVARQARRGRHARRVLSGWRAADDCQDPFAKSPLAEGLVLDPEPAAPLTPAGKRRPSLIDASLQLPADASRYVVTPGDTLSSIAASHGLSVDSVCSWNHIAHPDHTKLFPGQKLWVRGQGQPKPVATPWAPAAAGASSGSYTLRDGDNLWMVAKRLHIPVSDLMHWNQLDQDSLLHPGQVLRLSASN